jgi:hypothetical protein
VRQMSYANALRCIGQDLERRGLKCFDIRAEATAYVAQCGYQDPPAATPVTIHYRPVDLNELDSAGVEKRGHTAPAKEFLNQAQIFRTIGGFLDKNEAKLVRFTNNESPSKEAGLTVEYLTREGERVIDDRAGSAIYDMCVGMYKQRGRLTGTHGTKGRWRR